jgi:hypothetical protein
MFAEITKTFETNKKLAQDTATEFTSATVAFTKSVVDTNTRLAKVFQEQATAAYKSLETYKFPGFESFAPKATKASKE